VAYFVLTLLIMLKGIRVPVSTRKFRSDGSGFRSAGWRLRSAGWTSAGRGVARVSEAEPSGDGPGWAHSAPTAAIVTVNTRVSMRSNFFFSIRLFSRLRIAPYTWVYKMGNKSMD
jgi:hypothetical protein